VKIFFFLDYLTKLSTPLLLNPSRFIKYFSFLFLKILGLGLPGCGLGVTVPTSIKPIPRRARQSTYSAFLSSPAAIPS
jgi:hypothetical protein